MKFVNKNDIDLASLTMDPSEAVAKRREQMPPIFLDIRSTEDYKVLHMAGSNLIPFDFLEDHLYQLPPFAHIVVIGDENDEATLKAVNTLKDNGFNELSYIEGGVTKMLDAIKADPNEIFLADVPKEDWSEKIEAALTEKVRPALASDGGGLKVLKIQDDKLYIQYEGACSGCSSSTAGTLRFIQSAMRVALNHDIEVITS